MKYLVVSILFISSCTVEISSPATRAPVKVVSRIDTSGKIDFSKAPSYCHAERYIITVLPDGRFAAKLPHGTLIGVYSDIEEAQERINKSASLSRENYINSGGTDY